MEKVSFQLYSNESSVYFTYVVYFYKVMYLHHYLESNTKLLGIQTEKRIITKKQYINRHIRIKLHSCEIGPVISNFDDIRKSLTVLKTFKNSLKCPFCLISFLFCVCQRHAIYFSFHFIYQILTEFCNCYCYTFYFICHSTYCKIKIFTAR